MGLFNIPDPVSMFETALNGKLEREAENSLMSCMYSGVLSFFWRLGSAGIKFGLGPALQDMATAQYLSLTNLEAKNFLTLTVPKDMLDADNLAKFETSQVVK
jgi:hypothetical protein